jgi:hypothetical protein
MVTVAHQDMCDERPIGTLAWGSSVSMLSSRSAWVSSVASGGMRLARAVIVPAHIRVDEAPRVRN